VNFSNPSYVFAHFVSVSMIDPSSPSPWQQVASHAQIVAHEYFSRGKII
jgi:hypothetical protein